MKLTPPGEWIREAMRAQAHECPKVSVLIPVSSVAQARERAGTRNVAARGQRSQPYMRVYDIDHPELDD